MFILNSQGHTMLLANLHAHSGLMNSGLMPTWFLASSLTAVASKRRAWFARPVDLNVLNAPLLKVFRTRSARGRSESGSVHGRSRRERELRSASAKP